MASVGEFVGTWNWKLNLMLPSTISAVKTVLVLASHWPGPSEYIQVFPDQRCLDRSSNRKMRRERLSNAVPAGLIRDCNDGSEHEVMRCDVV